MGNSTSESTGFNFQHFVTQVFKNCEADKTAASKYKRCNLERTEHYAWPLLSRHGVKLTNPVQLSIAKLIASSIAYESGSQNGHLSLGRALKELNQQIQSAETRLLLLIGCDSSLELCKMLPSVIRLLQSKSIRIDYVRLCMDLYFYDKSPSSIRTRWAEDFYSYSSSDKEVSK